MEPSFSRLKPKQGDISPDAPRLKAIPNGKMQQLSHAWQGALWKVFSCLCFAGINGIVRYLTGGSPIFLEEPLPVSVITFFQNAFGTLFLLPFLFKYGIGSFSTKLPGLHAVRVISAVLGVFLWYWALSHMPIAQAVALGFTGPVFTVIAARFFLGEYIDKRRMAAIALSLVGAFIILRPDLAFFGGVGSLALWTAWLPLMSAIAIAVSKLSTRKLGMQGESAHVLTIYLLLFMAPISAAPALFDWTMPRLGHWPWLLLMGLLAAGAHFATSISYIKGEITFLTPFGFSKLFFSIAVGYFAFSEFPQSWALWFGIAAILASVLLLSNKGKTKNFKIYPPKKAAADTA